MYSVLLQVVASLLEAARSLLPGTNPQITLGSICLPTATATATGGKRNISMHPSEFNAHRPNYQYGMHYQDFGLFFFSSLDPSGGATSFFNFSSLKELSSFFLSAITSLSLVHSTIKSSS